MLWMIVLLINDYEDWFNMKIYYCNMMWVLCIDCWWKEKGDVIGFDVIGVVYLDWYLLFVL